MLAIFGFQGVSKINLSGLEVLGQNVKIIFNWFFICNIE